MSIICEEIRDLLYNMVEIYWMLLKNNVYDFMYNDYFIKGIYVCI